MFLNTPDYVNQDPNVIMDIPNASFEYLDVVFLFLMNIFYVIWFYDIFYIKMKFSY